MHVGCGGSGPGDAPQSPEVALELGVEPGRRGGHHLERGSGNLQSWSPVAVPVALERISWYNFSSFHNGYSWLPSISYLKEFILWHIRKETVYMCAILVGTWGVFALKTWEWDQKVKSKELYLVNLEFLTDLCYFSCYILEKGGKTSLKTRIGSLHVSLQTLLGWLIPGPC